MLFDAISVRYNLIHNFRTIHLFYFRKTNKTTSKNESKKAVFVLVFDKSSMSEQSLKKLEQFLLNLKKINFTLEDVPSTVS